MPRPVFGQADWWTFHELEDIGRFDKAVDECFETKQARDAHELADEFCDQDEDGREERGYVYWPTLEFLVSRGTRTVLMVRRR